MECKSTVLIIDDSKEDIHFLMENLKNEFAVLVATNGKKGLELANKNPVPDVILLDVVMPEMDGYATCRNLKEDLNTHNIPVIFVSANNTTSEKLAGYDAGGSDYVIKPVQPDEMLQKVRLAISNKKLRDQITGEKDMAFKTAMTAMTSAGEQGVVLDFLRNSFAIDSITALASSVVEYMSRYELNCAVQMRSHRDAINHATNMPVPPLEGELLTRFKDAGRIVEQGRRSIFNFGGVSVLIKNMPEDGEKRGRFRDHLAVLFEGAEAKLNSLVMRRQLAELVAESRKTLQRIEIEQKYQKEESQKIMDEMYRQLEASFMSWGLTDEQEKILLNLVESSVEKSLGNFERGLKLDAELRTVIERFDQIGHD